MVDERRIIGTREQLGLGKLRIEAAQVELTQALQLEGDSESTVITDALEKLENIKQDIDDLDTELRFVKVNV